MESNNCKLKLKIETKSYENLHLKNGKWNLKIEKRKLKIEH